MAAGSEVQGVRGRVPARGALRLRALLRPARGRLRPQRAERPTSPSCAAASRRGPQNIWRYADFLPLAGAARPVARATSRAACRPAARRWSAPTGSPSASACARCGSRTTPRTRRTRSRTASSPSRSPAPASSASRRSPAPRPATSPTRSPPTRAALGLDAYVFIPSDLEEQKILATGVYGTQPRRVSGNYDDVNRLCTELSGERELGVRERQPAPVLRRGLQDARVRDRRAARLGAARPRRRADRLRLAVHEDRARASRSGIDARAPRRRACRR